jgi:hypothetical protein
MASVACLGKALLISEQPNVDTCFVARPVPQASAIAAQDLNSTQIMVSVVGWSGSMLPCIVFLSSASGKTAITKGVR